MPSYEKDTDIVYYDLDLNPEQYFSVDYYLHAQEDLEEKQTLTVLFCDIEVYNHHRQTFPDPDTVPGVVTAISTYSQQRGYRTYFLGNLPDGASDSIRQLAEIHQEPFELKICDDEISLLTMFWKELRDEDPAILSGWNSDLFDYPYLYNRLRHLMGPDAVHLVSRFGQVWYERRRSQKVLRIPEYAIVDLLYLYKPRLIEGNQEGGLNYGKVLPSYSLDYVAEHVLGERKLSVPWSSLDDLYDQDPVRYLAYNLRDVVLVKHLNDKLQHIELHNLIRRLSYASMNVSLKGTTKLLDTYLYHRLKRDGLVVRSGLAYEDYQDIRPQDLAKLPRPKGLKTELTPLSRSEVKSLIHRFPGAYVKDPPIQKLFTSRDGIIGDLDATSLYPSMILQYNISFETLFGIVVEPKIAGLLEFLQNHLGKPEDYPPELYPYIFSLSHTYAKARSVQNRSEMEAKIYTIIAHFLYQLKESKLTLEELMEPSTKQARRYLKTYLVNLLILLTEVYDPEKEVNSFAYDMLVNGEPGTGEVYVVENFHDQTTIRRQPRESFLTYLKDNQLILTLSGGLFYTHDRPGMFSEFLQTMSRLRRTFKEKRDQNPHGSDLYRFYDHRQTAVKIIANSLYGLLGQKGFRFSNSILARAVTVSGRHTLKIAQQIVELLLTSKG